MIYVIIAVIFIIVLVMMVFKRKKNQKKDELYQMEIKMRDEKLNEYINNSREEQKLDRVYQPYKVNYSEADTNQASKAQHMFQLIETTERAERKYLFYRDEVIFIGERNHLPTIFRKPEGVLVYCKIGWKQGYYCISSSGQTRVWVKRKKSETLIDHVGIQLETNDRIFVSKVQYLFQIIR